MAEIEEFKPYTIYVYGPNTDLWETVETSGEYLDFEISFMKDSFPYYKRIVVMDDITHEPVMHIKNDRS